MLYAEQTITMLNRRQRMLYATVTVPATGNAPLVLLLHGFKGFRNWAFWPIAAQGFASEGCAVVRLDFALNGMRGTSDRVVSYEDFAANTLLDEVHDVLDLLAAIEVHSDFAVLRAAIDSTQLHLVGHSRGGGIAMVAARMLTEAGKPPTTVTGWNSVGSWERIGQHQLELWRQQGYVEVLHARTQQTLRMNYSYVESYVQHREDLSLQRAAKTLGNRLHFVHAERDLTVPVAEIRRLITETQSPARIDVVPGSTHTFGMQHPTEQITPAFAQAFQHTVRWMHQ